MAFGSLHGLLQLLLLLALLCELRDVGVSALSDPANDFEDTKALFWSRLLMAEPWVCMHFVISTARWAACALLVRLLAKACSTLPDLELLM